MYRTSSRGNVAIPPQFEVPAPAEGWSLAAILAIANWS